MVTVKPRFEGMLIERPINGLSADFLRSSHGEDIFREARDLAVNKYGSAKPLMVAVYNNNIAQVSNPFYVVLVNEVLRQDSSQKVRTATQADIERILRAGDPLKLKENYYVDTALVLRSAEDSYKTNASLAKDLIEQVKRRQGEHMKLPVMIPLYNLDLNVADNNYGLGFTLREDAQIIHAPVLNQSGKFSSVNYETGLPDSIGEGNRTLYTRKDGLSRLYLGRDLDLYSNRGNLGNSYEAGRVVVCGEAAHTEDLEQRAK